ncbi:hypothetical protein [Massilia sp. CCM 8734]|uniref:hypothetical protein n=1 Tax=Massilia sp. CCM 8734 TaxID=2609283 RepID=UPI00141DCFA6|nr:hypothetical protein [Massilia sp. CCM 8734]NIA00892.1 hypothetical protein [Massilia sp. CCM 8734]
MMNRKESENQLPVRNSMLVAAAGLCCAVGYQLDAAQCAMRANLDHFQESNFYTFSSKPIVAAMLPDSIYGNERAQRWIEYAIRDCMTQMKEPTSLFDTARTAIIMLVADQSRPHSDSAISAENMCIVMKSLAQEIFQSDKEKTANLHNFTVLTEGRAGLGMALFKAAQILINEDIDQVLLIGVDSYLNAADINSNLHQNRLCTTENSDGFVPGEAAAALLLCRTISGSNGLHIRGVGIAHEPGRHDGSIPCRSQGLTAAIRAACGQANIHPTDLDFYINDQNGESFFSQDSTNALMRVMFGGGKLVHLTLADKIGDVGAAAGPSMLAWLHRLLSHPVDTPGRLGLAHLANDDGTRCAVVIQYNGDK